MPAHHTFSLELLVLLLSNPRPVQTFGGSSVAWFLVACASLTFYFLLLQWNGCICLDTVVAASGFTGVSRWGFSAQSHACC